MTLWLHDARCHHCKGQVRQTERRRVETIMCPECHETVVVVHHARVTQAVAPVLLTDRQRFAGVWARVRE